MVNNFYSWLENIETYVEIFVFKIHRACLHPSALQTHCLCFVGKKGYKYYFSVWHFVKHESWSTIHACSELSKYQGCFRELFQILNFGEALHLAISFCFARNDRIYLNKCDLEHGILRSQMFDSFICLHYCTKTQLLTSNFNHVKYLTKVLLSINNNLIQIKWNYLL